MSLNEKKLDRFAREGLVTIPVRRLSRRSSISMDENLYRMLVRRLTFDHVQPWVQEVVNRETSQVRPDLASVFRPRSLSRVVQQYATALIAEPGLADQGLRSLAEAAVRRVTKGAAVDPAASSTSN